MKKYLLIPVLALYTMASFCQYGDSLIQVTNQLYMITGHGKLANTDDLREQGRYISDLRNEINSLIKQEKTLEEIKKQIKMPDYSLFEFQYMLPIEIEAIYKELTER